MNTRILIPAPLEKGQTIAVIGTSGRLDEARFKLALDAIRQAGFAAVEWPKKKTADAFFFGTDEERAEELEWALSEPGISMIWCARGGYGVQRTLRALEARPSFKKPSQPRWILGYSDITYLLHYALRQWGWATLHGPLCGSIDASQTEDVLDQVVRLTKPNAEIDAFTEVEVVRKKSARGLVQGGNLSLLQVAGAAKLIETDTILFIEDVNEDFYRLDRMFQVLIDAGFSKFIRAIVLGSLTNCGKNDQKTFQEAHLMKSLAQLTDGPVWAKAQFGHGLPRQRVFSVGQEVTLSGSGVIRIERHS